MNPLTILALQVPCVLFATTLHEFVRAAVSTYLGDNRPKDDGRLTINPFKHFEPIGFMLAVITGFGWGLPVQTSSLYYKDRKKGTLLCAVIPTVANLAAAAMFGILAKFMTGNFYIFMLNIVRINVSIAVYNILPVTPMDGLKVMAVVAPANTYFRYIQYEKIIQMIFLLLLFMGYTNIIFMPVINIITYFFA
ncbi:MAG: site-2 protease family protein [Firmicutes bacterium]|nr:site-2 protease family protein [Bacillota bacterium]